MKKIKIMLASLALLAVVGGALAFKAKFPNSFCTTFAASVGGVWTCSDANGVRLTCPTTLDNSTTDNPGSAQPVCTIDKPLAGCNPALGTPPNCAAATKTIIAE